MTGRPEAPDSVMRTEDNSDKRALDQLVRTFFSVFTNTNGATPDVEGVYDLFIPEGVIAPGHPVDDAGGSVQ